MGRKLQKPINGAHLRRIYGGAARTNFRIHALAVPAPSVQIQQDRASFAVRHGGEPQLQYSSPDGEDRQLYTRTNESQKLTDLRRGRPIPMLRLIARIWQWRTHRTAISSRQSDKRGGSQREKRKP
jgi:hypothetical protein